MARKTAQVIRTEAKEVVEELLDAVVKEREEIEGQRIPGRVIRGAKTPWTRRDVDNVFPPVTFIPEETIPVTYNGVRYQLFSDVEMTVPSIIRDIYVEHRRRARQSVTQSLASIGVDILGQGGLTD